MDQIKANGRTFERLPNCAFGDYGGDGSCGLSNIRVLKERYEWQRLWCSSFSEDGTCFDEEHIGAETVLIIVEYAYSGLDVFMDSELPEYAETAGSLEDYPVLDEEDLGELEYEWSSEAIDDQFSDMVREVRAILARDMDDGGLTQDECDEIEEGLYDLNRDQIHCLWREAAEQANEYPAYEASSAWWDAGRFADKFLALYRAQAPRLKQERDRDPNQFDLFVKEQA